jgi:hypothetical protein
MQAPHPLLLQRRRLPPAPLGPPGGPGGPGGCPRVVALSIPAPSDPTPTHPPSGPAPWYRPAGPPPRGAVLPAEPRQRAAHRGEVAQGGAPGGGGCGWAGRAGRADVEGVTRKTTPVGRGRAGQGVGSKARRCDDTQAASGFKVLRPGAAAAAAAAAAAGAGFGVAIPGQGGQEAGHAGASRSRGCSPHRVDALRWGSGGGAVQGAGRWRRR